MFRLTAASWEHPEARRYRFREHHSCDREASAVPEQVSEVCR